MSFAGSNRTGLYRVAEGVMGTTPSDPVMVPLRYTGESIGFNIETVVSNEIRDDRQVTDLVNTGQESSGGFDMEMSFGAFDDLIEAAAFSDYSTAIAVTNGQITFANGASTIVDAGAAASFANASVGQWIKVIAATNNANQKFFRITAKADDDTITVSPAPVDEVSASGVIISGQMLRNGTTQKSFTLEKVFNDTTPPVFQYFTGMNVNGMSNSFEVGSILTGSFDFMGFGADISTNQAAGATRQAAASGQVLNSVTNLQNVLIDNADSTACITSMSVDLANNLRSQKCIGSLASVGIGVGRFEVTGSISIFFEDLTEYNKFINSTAFSLSMRAEDNAGNAYVYTFPNVKYESMSLNSSGTDTDIILEGSYRGLLDPVSGCMFQLDRLPALVTNTSVTTVDTLEFSLSNEEIAKSSTGVHNIVLTRVGDGVGAVSVDVAVVAATSTAQVTSDYTLGTTTISWADGDVADKNFVLTTLDDGSGLDDVLYLELTNLTGSQAAIGDKVQTRIDLTG